MASGVDIDVKLKWEAERLHLKLEKELDIKNFIASVAHVDNYKTILKSVKTLNEKMDRAAQLDVQLEDSLIEEINSCTQRLTAERNLRFEMDNVDVMGSNDDTIGAMQDLIQKATETGVEEVYMQQANKMGG